MDPGTSAAIAALAIAVLAILISTAQVVQQYYSTGALIRLCDSVVFGPMPGKGRRVWVMSQFRFRVVYSVPQISVSSRCWEYCKGLAPSYAQPEGFMSEIVRKAPLELLHSDASSTPVREGQKSGSIRERAEVPKGTTPRGDRVNSGEACWVSFCQLAVEYCGSDVRYEMIEFDADRCPADLPTVPMPVSLRDIAVIALMMGFDCTHASYSQGSLRMQGPAGSITTSQHPILGPLLHFSRRTTFRGARARENICLAGWKSDIPYRWMLRLFSIVTVAGTEYDHRQRRRVERLNGKFLYRFNTVNNGGSGLRTFGKPAKPEPRVKMRQDDSVHISSMESHGAPTASKDQHYVYYRGPHDADWDLTFVEPPSLSKRSNDQDTHLRPPTNNTTKGKDSVREKLMTMIKETIAEDTSYQDQPVVDEEVGSKYANYQKPTVVNDETNDQTTNYQKPSVVDEADDGSDGEILHGIPKGRWRWARERQTQRSTKVRQAVEDEELVAKMVNAGQMYPIRELGASLLLTANGEPELPQDREEATPPAPDFDEARAAREREEERLEARAARDRARDERNKRQNKAAELGRVNWYWLCQMDVFSGAWATQWRHACDEYECIGAITVIIEALIGLIPPAAISYIGQRSGPGWPAIAENWMNTGHVSFPGYAENARGGVVCASDTAVKIDAFRFPIPRLALYHSYDAQVVRGHRRDAWDSHAALLELTSIDSWLSLCSRTKEIINGRNGLLRQTPALVQDLMVDFALDFTNIDSSATDGGFGDIQGLAANVMDFLEDRELSDAELIFILVAVLRAAKVGLCILAGPNSSPLYDILVNDVQAHMV